MIFKNTVLQCQLFFITCVMILGLSGDSINFTGNKYKLKDGRTVLLFTCSSTTTPYLPYAEFLVNDESAAGATFNKEKNKCQIRTPKEDCTDVCTCSSDGKIFTWTYPMISSKKTLRFSCHMFIKNEYEYEQSNVIYNGKDFTSDTPDYVTPSIKTITTDDIQVLDENNNIDKTQDDNDSTGLFIGLAVFLTLLVILMLCAFYCLKFEFKKQKREKKKHLRMTERTVNEKHSDEHPFLHVNSERCTYIETDHDYHRTLTIKVHDNTEDDQEDVQTNQETEEVQSLIKLNRLISKIGMKVIRAFFMKVLQINDLQTFLKHNKHLLFHAVYPKRQCCKCSNEKVSNDHDGVLLIQQFKDIYQVSDEIQSCEFDNQTNCICRFIPTNGISEDTFSLSSIIGILTVVPARTTTLQDLIQIRRVCNEIACLREVQMVSNQQFKVMWERVKNSLLGLASNVDIETKEKTGNEIKILFEEITEKTADEFSEVLSQWQTFHDLSIQQQDEVQFQKAAERFGTISLDTNKMILHMIDQVEIYIPDLDSRLRMDTLEDKLLQEALIKVSIPHTWNLDVLPMRDMKANGLMEIVEKSFDGKSVFLVTNIKKELFEDKTKFVKALLDIVKDIVKLNRIDLSSTNKIQIDFTFSKVQVKELSKPTLRGLEPVRMYLHRGGKRFINCAALLSDDEVVFVEQINKVLVIYNYKTQVRHVEKLLGTPFHLAVLPNNHIAVSCSDIREIRRYSNKLSLIDRHKMNEKCFAIGKRDENSLYVFIEDKGLCVLCLDGKSSPVVETTLPDYDPCKDSISFGYKRIYYTSRKKNAVFCYDTMNNNVGIIDGTFNNPSSIASMENCVFVSVSYDSGEVYVKRVEGSSHQEIFSNADGLDMSNTLHLYDKRSWLMFVNKETGFASYRKLQWLGAQVAVNPSKT